MKEYVMPVLEIHRFSLNEVMSSSETGSQSGSDPLPVTPNPYNDGNYSGFYW